MMYFVWTHLLVVASGSSSSPPDWEVFPFDPTGIVTNMHLIGETKMDFFSVSNPSERCNPAESYIADPDSSVKFVQFRAQTEPVAN